MNSLKSLVRGNVRQYGMVIALVAIVVLFQITTDGILLRPLNLTNLFTQNASILILAIGMVIVIIARHIDLSVGSVAAFVGAVAAILMTKYDVPWVLAVILCLGLGLAIGAWHGFWVAYVGIPAFIVTLASMLIFRGLTLVVLKGATVGGLPDGFEAMGNGFLPDIGPDTGLSNLTLLIAALLAVFLVVAEHQHEHGEREQVEVREEPREPGVAVHVADRVEVDQRADTGDEQHHGHRQRIDEEVGANRQAADRYPREQVEHELPLVLVPAHQPGEDRHRRAERAEHHHRRQPAGPRVGELAPAGKKHEHAQEWERGDQPHEREHAVSPSAS